MLHALLRGKLSETVPEPQRLEDALTSTVFGTLVLVEAWALLAHWLSRARDAEDQMMVRRVTPTRCDAWFWPGLFQCEPDVVLRLDERLYVVEAKYSAGRHDTRLLDAERIADEAESAGDQLCRQWAALEALRAGHGHGPTTLQDAVVTCKPVFVFLVDRRRMRVAARELAESRTRLPATVDLRLLTWQDLYRVLRDWLHEGASARWADELARYLVATGLDDFYGMTPIPQEATASFRWLSAWRGPGSEGWVGQLRHAVSPMSGLGSSARARLVRWSPSPPRDTGPMLREAVSRLTGSRARVVTSCVTRFRVAEPGRR
jgi:hypothetical protein